jgi:uncharacterized protein (DUF433 family)
VHRPGDKKQRPRSWERKPKAPPPPRPSPQELVNRYVEQDSASEGSADAHLRDSGMTIRTIVTYLGVYQNDRDKVAQHFDISSEEVEAAAAYYQMNKAEIDTQMTAEDAQPQS